MKVQEYGNYTFPLAVAIVLSGMYEDDLDNADNIVYTGQGGQNLTGNKRQIGDQKLERGNLALKVCNYNVLTLWELWFPHLFLNLWLLMISIIWLSNLLVSLCLNLLF